MMATTICVSLLPTALTISNPTPKNRPILENLTKKDTAKPSRSFRDAVL